MRNWRKLYEGRPGLYADNFEANAGSGGDTFGADDIGGVKFPRSKIIIGADGSNDGDVSSANPLPVTGTVAVTNGALTELAAAINSSQVDVNLAASNATVTVAAHHVTNAGTFAVQVDGSALTSLQVIDDLVFVDDAAFTAATSKVAAVGGIVTSDSVDNGDIGAFAMLANRQQKVTLYDSSGVELSVGGGTQYTEDAAATANPVGNAIILIREDARGGSLTSDDGDNVALRGNNLGEAYVKDTDVAALLTTIDGDTGNIVTAVQLLDDAVYVDDADWTDNTSKHLLVGGVYQSSPHTVTDGDVSPFLTDANGRMAVTVNGTVTVGSHAVTNAGTFPVQVDGAALTSLQVIDNPVLVDDAAFTPATSSVMMAGFEADEGSTDSVDEGDAGAARMTLDRKVITTPQPHSTGGLSTARSLDLDESEEQIKATAGQVYGWNITNFRTSTVYVKFYNDTAANVAVGTTTPLFTLAIPGNTNDDTMLSMMGTHGIVFDTAITWAATTGLADNDTGAPGANDVAGTVWYK